MGRSRYKIIESGKTYFITSSVINWLSLFAMPAPAGIVIDSLNFLQQQQRIKIHVHLVATSANISSEMRKMKSYTARCIVDYLKANGPEFLLEQLKFYKKKHKNDQIYQVWQEGLHPKLILDEKMLTGTIEYIYYNPVKRGYIDKPEHWRYSSSRDYIGLKGLVAVKPLV